MRGTTLHRAVAADGGFTITTTLPEESNVLSRELAAVATDPPTRHLLAELKRLDIYSSFHVNRYENLNAAWCQRFGAAS